MVSRSGDRTLRRAVHGALVAEPVVDARRIGVSVDSGVVTLLGWVTGHTQKDAARAAARRVEGVEVVIDRMRVGLPSLPYRTHRPVGPGRTPHPSHAP